MIGNNVCYRWRNWAPLLVLTLIAFAIRWYYVSTALVLNPVRGDATQYVAYAWNLASHGVFARDVAGAAILHPDSYRDPGYPFFLALWITIFGTGGTWYAAVLLSQALLGALTTTFTVLLGRYWLPVSWAYACGILFAVWPHAITINGYLLTETLFAFLCVVGVWSIAHAIHRASIPRATIGGVTLGAAALTNAVLLPFAVLLACTLAWGRRASISICVAMALGACLLPGAWMVRNFSVPPPDIGSSTSDRAIQNFVQGASPGFHQAYRSAVFGTPAEKSAARKELDQVNAEYKRMQVEPLVGGRAIVQRMTDEPWRYAMWYLYEKPAELWGWAIVIGQGDIYVYPTRNAPFQTNPAWIALAATCHALNGPLALLMLVSFPILWRRARDGQSVASPGFAGFIATACLVGYVTLVYSLLQAEPRYSIPFRSFQMLLAMTSLYWISARLWSMRNNVREQTPQRKG